MSGEDEKVGEDNEGEHVNDKVNPQPPIEKAIKA